MSSATSNLWSVIHFIHSILSTATILSRLLCVVLYFLFIHSTLKIFWSLIPLLKMCPNSFQSIRSNHRSHIGWRNSRQLRRRYLMKILCSPKVQGSKWRSAATCDLRRKIWLAGVGAEIWCFFFVGFDRRCMIVSGG
ncbi:hypothetical protein BGZ57DRAFT_910189 [Hyaloscypha finlandica]|nr:hypothetical protein BGZ57DRAFT_910189 [Hyaloscypha finlandica]